MTGLADKIVAIGRHAQSDQDVDEGLARLGYKPARQSMPAIHMEAAIDRCLMKHLSFNDEQIARYLETFRYGGQTVDSHKRIAKGRAGLSKKAVTAVIAMTDAEKRSRIAEIQAKLGSTNEI